MAPKKAPVEEPPPEPEEPAEPPPPAEGDETELETGLKLPLRANDVGRIWAMKEDYDAQLKMIAQLLGLEESGPPISRNPDITSMTEEDVAAYREEMDMTVTGATVKPVKKFTHITNMPHPVAEYVKKFEKPSPIQAQAWPALLSGKNVIGIAKTGSGKTLAFMMPAYVHLKHELAKRPVTRKDQGPLVLVIAPTRELAMQTAKVCNDVQISSELSVVCVYGGSDKWAQINAIKDGAHVVIATTGRLLDITSSGHITLKRVSYLVLDEADRMLDTGFEKDIRALFNTHLDMNALQQVLLFSATWPESIQKLALEYIKDPVHVRIGSDELTTNHDVTQTVEVLDDDNRVKDKRLLQLMRKYFTSNNRIIIFALFKKDVPRIERLLNNNGHHAGSISSDRSQFERTKALDAFTKGTTPLLVATDVAARGLDIPNVGHVINYSFPLTVEDYVHRIGRTGRGGAKGIAHTFFTKYDKTLAGELINLLREAGAEIPEALPKFGAFTKKKEHGMYGAHFKKDDRPMKAPTRMKFI